MRALIGFFLKAFSYFLRLWPRSWLRAAGALVGILWIDILRFRRRIVLDNLRLAFPEWTEEKRIAVGRASVRNMGSSFAELYLIPSMDDKWIEQNVVLEGLENFRQAQALGKGLYFLTLHLGNGDLAANVVARKLLHIHIITKKFKNKLFNDLWFLVRGGQGVQYIEAHGNSTPFDILKAVKRNEGVFFVVDQFMGKPYGVETLFFGKKTGTAYGLALFSQKTKSPVVPVYTFEGEDGKIHIRFEPMMDLSGLIGEDKAGTQVRMTQAFADKVEEIVRKHPEQWLWVHRRWKDFE